MRNPGAIVNHNEKPTHTVTGVLMCPPAFFTVRDVKNPFMRVDAMVDRDRAAHQWESLKNTFARLGVTPHVLEPADDLEDMVFAANQAFIGAGIRHARFAVPSRMRYSSRQREVPFYVDWLARNGFTVIDAALEDEFLEGHGDLLQHPGRNLVWAGHGFRSSREGIAKFARAVQGEGLTVAPLQLVDEVFYHLDTCFAPLSEDAAIVYPDALDAESLDALRRGWTRLYDIERDDALQFVCNGVAVNERFVVSHLTPALRRILDREKLMPEIVDVSEFEKAGGSVFCLKALLP